ncbi:unnamed protein product [Lactuca virosa]|uniref:AT-hook motif nuclear-localized protein n=1 Tax=Lactuca virosa TaxID=75947 RepID=A0AAU9PPY0_9ASTR|nr:unnamed protein product [Lactuca virosa]
MAPLVSLGDQPVVPNVTSGNGDVTVAHVDKAAGGNGGCRTRSGIDTLTDGERRNGRRNRSKGEAPESFFFNHERQQRQPQSIIVGNGIAPMNVIVGGNDSRWTLVADSGG